MKQLSSNNRRVSRSAHLCFVENSFSGKKESGLPRRCFSTARGKRGAHKIFGRSIQLRCSRLAAAVLEPPRARVSKNVWALLLLCGVWIAGCGKTEGPSSGPSVNPATQRTNTVAASSATAATNEIPMHRSVFDDTSKTGKDPFFPSTTRRERPVAQNGAAKPQQPKLPPSGYLRVTGIWPNKTRPLVLINKVIFAPGERGEVPYFVPELSSTGPLQKVQVHVMEIRERSVLVSVEGEPGTIELSIPDRP
jgi:hypothetical protein